MITTGRVSGLALTFLSLLALTGSGQAKDPVRKQGAEVTIKGSMVCNGACIPEPKAGDHVMVVFAIDGPRETRAEVDQIDCAASFERGRGSSLSSPLNARRHAPVRPYARSAGTRARRCGGKVAVVLAAHPAG